MNLKELIQKAYELEREIALLPPGSITKKTIKGKDYYYHRINKNNHRTETFINLDKLDELREEIDKRKVLEKELKELKTIIPTNKTRKRNTYEYSTYVRTGEQLYKYAEPIKDYKHRECYSLIYDYIFKLNTEKVFILYGLRRTGKTTLIRQIFLDMNMEQLEKTAFIQVRAKNTLSELNKDLSYLEDHGYKYVFIDEVTLIEDFIEGAALFSDIYASSGMKIVLSGTDSLGFAFTEQEQLYDRCILLHTTFIPYREFEEVLGIKGIDEYIRYGGTMSISGINYNEDSVFASLQSSYDYIDSAIAKNIQHSLKYYQNGGHFRHLYELYQSNELTSAINRVVEDINHRFTKDVLTRTFKSNDIALSARNLIKDKSSHIDLLDNIDLNGVTNTIKTMLEILVVEEQSTNIDDAHAYQIKEYLLLLDLITEIDLVHFPDINPKDKIIAISQPGLRYAQSTAVINGLLSDNKFNQLSIIQRTYIQDRILSEIKGRMMEDIVLLETKLANPKKQVFKLQFNIGEFDMVIYDPLTLTCEVFEIKYSDKIINNQYQHLINKQKCLDTEHHFGTITNRYVIYRGEDTTTDNIKYLNVENYLKSLKNK